jgi:hypothetical protein
MRALNTQIELSCTPRVLAWVRDWGMRQGSNLSVRWEYRKGARIYKNRGNEAKKYLKTKDITLLSAANCAHFARKFAQFGR